MMNSDVSSWRRLFYWEVVLAGVLLVAGSLVISNNTVRSAPIFILILMLGVGIMLGLGLLRGGLMALVLIAAWFTAKQTIGVWHEAHFAFNLLEIAMVALTFVLAGFHHDRLQSLIKQIEESKLQLKQLDLVDVSVGLLKRSIGILRLGEEEERAVRFRRPLSLLLVRIEPCDGKWEPGESTAALRAIASNIKDTTRRADIPFLADSNEIGVILPETETAGANKAIDHIIQRLATTRLITSTGSTRTINERAQLRFGLASFPGMSSTPIHMFEAAEASLAKDVRPTRIGVSTELAPESELAGDPAEIALPLRED